MTKRFSRIVTIQLSEEQYHTLNHLRAQTNRSMAELIRCAIDSYLIQIALAHTVVRNSKLTNLCLDP